MIHLEALNENGKKLLPYLGFKNYYLAGGTAIALQIGHRVSVDFDFFSDTEIPKSLLSSVKKKFPEDFLIKTTVNDSTQLTLFVNDVKLSFIFYPFPLIQNLVPGQGFQLMSLEELAATKAYTIGRRGELKDYIDLYFLFKQEHTSLKSTLDLAQKKYGADFNSRLFLEQLIYLEDLEELDIQFLKEKISKTGLKEYFSSIVKELF